MSERRPDLTSAPPMSLADATVLAWRHEIALGLGYDDNQALELAGSRADLHDLEQLLTLGYPSEQASLLARARIDVTNVRKLIAAGCALDTAARVAWPLPEVTAR